MFPAPMDTRTRSAATKLLFMTISSTPALSPRLQGFRSLLHLSPDAQEVAAPQLGDVAFRVSAAQQFSGHVLTLAFVVPPQNAAAMIEVGRDADVVDADLLYGVSNRIH